ncbi:hypothetical protein [Domibacillus sp. A3M-37]|nr:hypothetical protein [Domibacillus sp. A3M-37]
MTKKDRPDLSVLNNQLLTAEEKTVSEPKRASIHVKLNRKN